MILRDVICHTVCIVDLVQCRSPLAQAAGDVEGFAGNPGRIRGRKEDGGASDVLRLSDPAERRCAPRLACAFRFQRCRADRVPSVSTIPGLMALTRILRGPSSFANERVIASTAPLVPL